MSFATSDQKDDELLRNDDGKLLELPEGLKEQCKRAHGWTDESCEDNLKSYRQFMKLKLIKQDYKATQLSPSLAVDKVWHEHLLNPAHYAEACITYTGGHVIGHDPNGGLDSTARGERIEATKAAFKAHFGQACHWKFNVKRQSEDADEHCPVKKCCSHGSDEPITLIVREWIDKNVLQQTFFKVKKTTKMSAIIKTYAARRGDAKPYPRLLFDGERIEPSYTPNSLHMKDRDQIDVIPETSGC